MFERFTEAARQVVVKAQEAAREMDHTYIGTEHVLLGLLADPSELPAVVLSTFGIGREHVRAEVLARVGRGKEPPSRSQIPFTPRAKKVLELGLREALSLGHTTIGSGHLLLGLLREGEGVGAEILVSLGAEPGAMRELTVERLGGPDPPSQQPVVRLIESDVSITVHPDEGLRRLLREAAMRALRAERPDFGVADVLEALQDLPELGPESG